MGIGYRKRHLNVNLILRVAFLILGIVGFLVKDTLRWGDYSTALISILYLTVYGYQKKYKYLILANGIMKINSPFGEKVKLGEIKQIKKFAGDYIIKTDYKKITINTQIIEPDSLELLNDELEKLDIV